MNKMRSKLSNISPELLQGFFLLLWWLRTGLKRWRPSACTFSARVMT